MYSVALLCTLLVMHAVTVASLGPSSGVKWSCSMQNTGHPSIWIWCDRESGFHVRKNLYMDANFCVLGIVYANSWSTRHPGECVLVLSVDSLAAKHIYNPTPYGIASDPYLNLHNNLWAAS